MQQAPRRVAVMTSIQLAEDLHTRLKNFCVNTDQSMRAVITESVERHLEIATQRLARRAARQFPGLQQ